MKIWISCRHHYVCRLAEETFLHEFLEKMLDIVTNDMKKIRPHTENYKKMYWSQNNNYDIVSFQGY